MIQWINKRYSAAAVLILGVPSLPLTAQSWSYGDLTDRGSNAEVDLWKQTAQPLVDAGIPFWAVRRNHDVKGERPSLFGRATDLWDAQFPQFSGPGVIEGPGASYMFVHENTAFFMADTFGPNPLELFTWFEAVAVPAADTAGVDHRVYLQHPPFYGKSRPGVFDEVPDLEPVFFGMLSGGGVDLVLTGHDHQYSRSAGLDDDGAVLLQHLITWSNSEKYHRNEEGLAPNEAGIAQINGRVGYSVVEVDGPLVAFTHYGATAPDPTTTGAWTPDWQVTDRFI